MEAMLAAAFCCFGVSSIMHSLSCGRKMEAELLRSVVRVNKLKDLEELVGENTSGLLVAVSGKVGSNEAFLCKRSGVLAVSLTEKEKLVFLTKVEKKEELTKVEDVEKKEEFDEIPLKRHSFPKMIEPDRWKEECEETILSKKTVPWFLEDKTAQVNVVGYYVDLKTYVFEEPVNELFQRVLHNKGVKDVSHTYSEQVFEIGTPLSFFAKAFRDSDGTLTIRQTHQISFKYFQYFFHYGESISKVVSDLESSSETSLKISVFFQNVGAVSCSMYVVHLMATKLIGYISNCCDFGSMISCFKA